MFAIVAVPFDAYQALPHHSHRWLATCLARYADREGKCWPTMRQLSVDARMSLSTVCRRLKEMADLGVFHRERKGVGRYLYQLAEAYRPRWPGRVSGVKHRVSQGETPEQANPAKQDRRARGARFAPEGVADGTVQWDARLRGWHARRFWLAWWGPRPGEAGCWAPGG